MSEERNGDDHHKWNLELWTMKVIKKPNENQNISLFAPY